MGIVLHLHYIVVRLLDSICRRRVVPPPNAIAPAPALSLRSEAIVHLVTVVGPPSHGRMQYVKGTLISQRATFGGNVLTSPLSDFVARSSRQTGDIAVEGRLVCCVVGRREIHKKYSTQALYGFRRRVSSITQSLPSSPPLNNRLTVS